MKKHRVYLGELIYHEKTGLAKASGLRAFSATKTNEFRREHFVSSEAGVPGKMT